MTRVAVVALLLVISLPLSAANLITVTAPDVDMLDADGNLDFHYTVRNVAANDLMIVTAAINFPAGFVFVRAQGADCAQAPDAVRCTLPPIADGDAVAFDVIVKPPTDHGRFFTAIAVTAHLGNEDSTVSAGPMALLYASFVVTTTADDGPGSLRQEIADANRDCVAGVPCRIQFAIREPLPERGWYTIAPQSPLPPVEAIEIIVDGQYFNSVPIEIRGTRAFGDGLVFHGTIVTLNGLSIDGFFDNGVVIDQKTPNGLLISNCTIGSDPSGAPVPNGLRGIALVRANGTVRDNTIGGNSRSGIFVTSTFGLSIHANRITNNGASGIYIGPSTGQVDVQGNVISGNHDFPIGTDVNAEYVAVRENVMIDNGAPFDIGMDGPGAPTSQPLNRIEPTPTITSAVYDAASGDTVVTIDVHPLYFNNATYTVYVFANHGLDRAGRAEAETFLGTVSATIDATSPTEATVVLRAHADLRGQILTALTLRLSPFEFDTREVSSELSDGVAVR